MNIRPAVEVEAPGLSWLAMRAKAHWGYAAEVLEQWRPELAISPTDVRERPTFVAEVGARVVGFYSLRPSGASWELDHLWVLPEFMHRGIGHALLSHALVTAESGGAKEVTVDSDPCAEALYLKWGATRRGEVGLPFPASPSAFVHNGRSRNLAMRWRRRDRTPSPSSAALRMRSVQ
jgi:GNAT superfamily N-acetyltransferase